MKATKQLYRVLFQSQGRLYEVYARSVSQGDLFGFVAVEELVFGERTQLVVDPGEERLKSEFSGVRRTYLPMHAVVRIDEVEKQGPAKIHDLGERGDKVSAFPYSAYPPGRAPAED